MSGAIVPRGQRESEIHNARVRVTAVMVRPHGSTVLLSQLNHSWEKKDSGKERGMKKEEWVQRAKEKELAHTKVVQNKSKKIPFQCKSLLNRGVVRNHVEKEERRLL